MCVCLLRGKTHPSVFLDGRAAAALAAEFCTKLMNGTPRFIVSRVIAINSKTERAGENLPRAAIVYKSGKVLI
jgi:hypothetical protein